ncbi:MAG: hypothetical protein ACD_11C00107G0006 [uncultured bacterium]|nr:MAG: hypothetical protein ACD_11C00107G0006 [uncultured bacterium]HBR71398.1 hypothetical protein [Candidatus Moranbacteria bacterium]
MKRNRISVGELNHHLGDSIFVEGLVYEIKDHGGILVIDLYDESGYVKAIIGPDSVYSHKTVGEIKKGFHIGVHGKVKTAPHSTFDVENENGNIEVDVEKMIIFGKKDKKMI